MHIGHTYIRRKTVVGTLLMIILMTIAGLFVYYSFYYFSPVISPHTGLRTIRMDGTPLAVTVADTEAERVQGLSGRKNLDFNEGMLFVFPKDDTYSFWMKDMNFPIDVFWVDASGTIVYIVPNMDPSSYPTAYINDTPARYVIETVADYAELHNISIGSHVDF